MIYEEIVVRLTVYTIALLLPRQQDRQNEKPQVMRLDGREHLPWAQWGGGEHPD